VFSVHHIAPELFGRFEETTAGVKLASAEKALRSGLFVRRPFTALHGLPELEIGKTFRWRELRRWVSRVPSRRARTLVEERIERFTGASSTALFEERCRGGAVNSGGCRQNLPRKVGSI
jgi:hypothetical protein